MGRLAWALDEGVVSRYRRIARTNWFIVVIEECIRTHLQSSQANPSCGDGLRQDWQLHLVFPDRNSCGSRIIHAAGESSTVILHVTVHTIGSITLNGVRNDDADQRVSEWMQSSLPFALRNLPALAALSPDVCAQNMFNLFLPKHYKPIQHLSANRPRRYSP